MKPSHNFLSKTKRLFGEKKGQITINHFLDMIKKKTKEILTHTQDRSFDVLRQNNYKELNEIMDMNEDANFEYIEV